jgi:transglutaminase-like putative cysteine protease
MKLRVEHTTLFEYEAPVYETATEVRLQPGEDPNSPLRVLSFTLTVAPSAKISHYKDFYGNNVHHFNLLQSHKRVEIVAVTVVNTGVGRSFPNGNEFILLEDMLSESRYVRLDPVARQFAQQFADIKDSYQQAEAICRTIYESFVYETGVTDVHSTSTEVMELQRGVCQDFAHVMIAVCRSLGLSTRYVSGYLYGGTDSESFDRASHAWCEVFCPSENSWIGFDPTHSNLLVDERYIKIGAGRDYSDVALVRGTYKGRSKENLKATVRITAARSDEN